MTNNITSALLHLPSPSTSITVSPSMRRVICPAFLEQRCLRHSRTGAAPQQSLSSDTGSLGFSFGAGRGVILDELIHHQKGGWGRNKLNQAPSIEGANTIKIEARSGGLPICIKVLQVMFWEVTLTE